MYVTIATMGTEIALLCVLGKQLLCAYQAMRGLLTENTLQETHSCVALRMKRTRFECTVLEELTLIEHMYMHTYCAHVHFELQGEEFLWNTMLQEMCTCPALGVKLMCIE